MYPCRIHEDSVGRCFSPAQSSTCLSRSGSAVHVMYVVLVQMEGGRGWQDTVQLEDVS